MSYFLFNLCQNLIFNQKDVVLLVECLLCVECLVCLDRWYELPPSPHVFFVFFLIEVIFQNGFPLKSWALAHACDWSIVLLLNSGWLVLHLQVSLFSTSFFFFFSFFFLVDVDTLTFLELSQSREGICF